MKNIFITLVFLGLFASLFFDFDFNEERFLQEKSNNVGETAMVMSVIDGDTIILESGERVRYIGIDTPEYSFDENVANECFGEEARERNKELVEGKRITLLQDTSEKDKYGRLLRYVYVDGILVSTILLEEGYADLMIIDPDTRYKNEFEEAYREAREYSLGMWKECYE